MAADGGLQLEIVILREARDERDCECAEWASAGDFTAEDAESAEERQREFRGLLSLPFLCALCVLRGEDHGGEVGKISWYSDASSSFPRRAAAISRASFLPSPVEALRDFLVDQPA